MPWIKSVAVLLFHSNASSLLLEKKAFHQNHFIGAIWGSAAPWLWRSRRGFPDGGQGGFGKILVFPLQSIAAVGGGQDCIDGGGGEEEE